jgi:hypothetical protein
MPRREFPKDVKLEIIRRARASGVLICEGCGLVVDRKKWHVDHTIPDALFLDKRRRLTADDGKLLGAECCHGPKTKIDVANIAEAKRREAKYLGMKTRAKAKIPSRPKPPKPAPLIEKRHLRPKSIYEVKA